MGQGLQPRKFSMKIILWPVIAIAVLAQSADAPWRDEGVLYLKRSPFARLKDVPVRAVTMGEGFWAARRRVNVERSIPTLLELLESNGIVDNVRRLSVESRWPQVAGD